MQNAEKGHKFLKICVFQINQVLTGAYGYAYGYITHRQKKLNH